MPPAPTNLPVAVPGPDYHPVAGGVNPSGPQPKQPKKRNGLLVVGIIVCILAAAVLAVALFYLMNRPADKIDVPAPSESAVEEAFEEANINSPTLTNYAYIDTEGLDDPQISDIHVGEVTQNGTGDSQKISCSTTAQVIFQNSSVNVEQTVQMPFTYNTKNSEWDAGKPSVQSSSEKVTPTGPADIAAIQEALPELLKAYDENIAAQYEGAEIAASGDLNETGGEITFALAKDNADGTHIQTDVNVGVVWDSNKGWVPTINYVGDAPAGDQPANGDQGQDQQDPNASGDQNQNAGNPSGDAVQNPSGDQNDMYLPCSTGDLVEVPGVIEYRDNRVLLRSDYTIRVVLDGRTYITTYFELTANTFVVTNGAHVSVIGEISATGTLPQAPLMISLDYEE